MKCSKNIVQIDYEQLFTKNCKLAYSIVHRFVREHPELKFYKDELMQSALLSLYKATKKFDETKGFTFSTYASKVIKMGLLKSLEEEFRSRRKNKLTFISIETPIGEDATLADCLEYIPPEDVSWIFNDDRLSKREKQICKMLYEGATQSEIAKDIGCSQVQVSRLIKKIRNKLEEN